MAIAVKPRDDQPDPLTGPAPNNRSLTPSDQLLGIFIVNLIIVIWVGVAFAAWYEHLPELPEWIYWVEGLILALSIGLALFDVWWPRVRDLGIGPNEGPESVNVNIWVLKVSVFALTGLYIFVLWRLGEETGGVVSPFAPFLTAPALFAPFVTRNWKTIIGLSLLVTVAIGFSEKTSTFQLDGLWPYKGSAAVMVLLAGTLTALRMNVSKRGSPLTGEGSDQQVAPPGPSPAT